MLDSLSHEDLQLIWFIIVGVLFYGYAILDGFDLGTGVIQLFIKGDTNRRLTLNAAGPVWDGNEVWLISGGGALFVAFPYVYDTVFSGFYLAFILLLAILTFRVVAVKFRNKQPMVWWRKGWDCAFALSSLLAALFIGVTIGNLTRGIPLDADGNFTGTFFSLLNPYSLLSGATTVMLFAVHGGIYLLMKTQDELRLQIRKILFPCMGIFSALILAYMAVTLMYVPRATEALERVPALYEVAGGAFFCLLLIWLLIVKDKAGVAFISSCAIIACMMTIFGVTMFPNLVYSIPEPKNSLTIYSASSGKESLTVMTWIAMVGIPVVLVYSIAIYCALRGKVKLNAHSY